MADGALSANLRGLLSVLGLGGSVQEMDVTRRLARGLSCFVVITTPSFVAGLSQVRPDRLIEQARF